MGQNKVKRYFYSPTLIMPAHAHARPLALFPCAQALGALGPLRARNYCVTFELALARYGNTFRTRECEFKGHVYNKCARQGRGGLGSGNEATYLFGANVLYFSSH